MKTQLIMLDTPVIVSDEEIVDVRDVKGKWHIEKGYIINQFPDYLTDLSECKLIIAGIEGLPSIDWNGLEEEFGWVDIEKLAKRQWGNVHRTGVLGFIEGFKKAQSLNEKKFSLEDVKPLKELVEEGYDPYDSAHHLQVQRMLKVIEEFIESLQQPKVFDIEVEEEEKFSHYSQDLVKVAVYKKVNKPKITNNSIKILKKL